MGTPVLAATHSSEYLVLIVFALVLVMLFLPPLGECRTRGF